MKYTARFLRSLIAVAVAAGLSACGGHSSMVPPSSPSGSSLSGNAKATLTVTIPAKSAASSARRPAYISSSTQSITLGYSIGTTQYPVQTLNVTPGSPGCTTASGITTCTLTFGATAGNITYTVSAYDGTNGSGNLLASAQSAMTVTAGKDNAFNITLDGVPASLGVVITGGDGQGNIPAGTPADLGITISAYDADYNLIVNSPAYWSASGNALTVATLTMAPDNGEITLAQNGKTLTPTGGAYQIAAPFTGVTAHYNGGLYASVTFTAGLGSLSTQQILNIRPVLNQYTTPTVGSAPFDIVSNSDGNLWFTEYQGNKIGKISTNGTITEYPLQSSYMYYPEGITRDASGNLWIAENGNGCACVAKMTTTGSIATFKAYQLGCQPYPAGIATTTDGNVWYTNEACSMIGYVNPGNGTGAGYGNITNDDWITTGPDGNLWSTDSHAGFSGSNLLRIDRNNGTVTKFPVTANIGPERITTGPDGKVWFTEYYGQIGKLDPSTGTVSEYPLPGSVTPSAITAGADGNLWITASTGIFRATTAGVVTQVDLYGNPAFIAQGSSIVSGPDGNLWFVEENGAAIGKVTIGKTTP